MGRLDAIAVAARPKMHGRAMLSGPSGAGKTWTALSMAKVLADGDLSRVLVIDTEKESALTYADVFPGFHHLPWRPPFDPTELTEAFVGLGDRFAVVITDSFTHFWRGQGGTLDIADGKFGGWKAARPVQERLTDAVLEANAHMILCVRSKMEYLAEGGSGGVKQTVTKLGLAPVQDDQLVYEMNVAFDIDLEHRITVTKSRTPAVPVGRMYPAGLERKAAEDYADWLAGGIPPAAREDVDRIVAMFAEVVDAERRKAAKQAFVQRWGMPASLTAEKVTDATDWLAEELKAAAADKAADHPDETPATAPQAPQEQPQPAATPETPPPPGDEPPPPAEPPAPADPPAPATTEPLDNVQATIDRVAGLAKADVIAELVERGLPTEGNTDTLRKRLAERLLTEPNPETQATLV